MHPQAIVIFVISMLVIIPMLIFMWKMWKEMFPRTLFVSVCIVITVGWLGYENAYVKDYRKCYPATKFHIAKTPSRVIVEGHNFKVESQKVFVYNNIEDPSKVIVCREHRVKRNGERKDSTWRIYLIKTKQNR